MAVWGGLTNSWEKMPLKKYVSPQGRLFKCNVWGDGWSVHDFLLIGWRWGGNRAIFQESQSSALWFQPVWDLSAFPQRSCHLPPRLGDECLSSYRTNPRCVSDDVYPLRRNQDSVLLLSYYHYFPPSTVFCLFVRFCVPSLSYLANAWVCSLMLREGLGD